jgi:hypothetical protein
MAQIFGNNVEGVVAAGGFAQSATTLSLADASLFPDPGADWYLATLSDSPETTWEIVRVTAKTGNDLTVVRAQESTSDVAWAAGSSVSLRMTAGTLESVNDAINAKAPAAPDWATLTTTGTSPSVTLTIPLDGGAYECQIPAGGIDVLAYTLPANDATAKQYGAYVKLTAPASGTETVTIPTAWDNMGPLGSISLTAGDDAITVVLWTDNDNDSAPTIQYAASQKDLQVPAGGVEAPASDGNYYAYKDGAWVNITNKIIDP